MGSIDPLTIAVWPDGLLLSAAFDASPRQRLLAVVVTGLRAETNAMSASPAGTSRTALPEPGYRTDTSST